MSSITENKKVLVAIVILVLVITSGGMYYWTQVLLKSNPTPLGQQCTKAGVIGMGDFTLPIVDRSGVTNRTLTLSDLACRVIVLEFMAPWCPPCQNVVPDMENLYIQYSNKGVVFIAIAVSWKPDLSHYQDMSITEFLSRYNSTLTYVYDTKGTVSSMYNIREVPTFFVLSKNGSINATYTDAGAVFSGSVAKAIDAALG